MKYIVFSTLILVISLSVGIVLTALINRRKKINAAAKAVVCLFISLCFFAGVFAGYLEVYSHAEPEAEDYLKSTSEVEISKTQNGWMFDGPGKENAVIFYPGAKVEASAYAPLLFNLACHGCDAFLVEMPMRMAFFDADAADNIIGEYSYKNWYMAGHSLGGITAQQYTAAHTEIINGVILLASYPSKRQPDETKLLLIYGTDDGCLDISAYNKSKALWTENAQEKIIEGGNHAQFGNYGFQKGDNKADISASEQQNQTVKYILDWF